MPEFACRFDIISESMSLSEIELAVGLGSHESGYSVGDARPGGAFRDRSVWKWVPNSSGGEDLDEQLAEIDEWLTPQFVDRVASITRDERARAMVVIAVFLTRDSLQGFPIYPEHVLKSLMGGVKLLVRVYTHD